MPAFSHSNTTLGGAAKAAVILGKLKVGLRLPRTVVRSQPQIFIQPVRLNQLARIHLPIGIPDRLELAKSLHQLGPKHFRSEEHTSELQSHSDLVCRLLLE